MQVIRIESVHDNRNPQAGEPQGRRFITGDNPTNGWAPPGVLAFHDSEDALGWTFGSLDEDTLYFDATTRFMYFYDGTDLKRVI